MMIEESELKKLVADGVRRTVNKFREYPHLFFTETDLHIHAPEISTNVWRSRKTSDLRFK